MSVEAIASAVRRALKRKSEPTLYRNMDMGIDNSL
jgi:hypothetical protein